MRFQIDDDENNLLLNPETNLVQTAIAKFFNDGLVDLYDAQFLSN